MALFYFINDPLKILKEEVRPTTVVLLLILLTWPTKITPW